MAIDDFAAGQLCRITIMNAGQDEAGGADRDPYTVVHDRIPVTVREMGGSRDRRNDKQTQVKIGRCYFTRDLGLTVKHQIELLDAGGASVRWLTITSVVNVNNLGRLWQVDFEEAPV